MSGKVILARSCLRLSCWGCLCESLHSSFPEEERRLVFGSTPTCASPPAFADLALIRGTAIFEDRVVERIYVRSIA
jgi:hypothetical protein